MQRNALLGEIRGFKNSGQTLSKVESSAWDSDNSESEYQTNTSVRSQPAAQSSASTKPFTQSISVGKSVFDDDGDDEPHTVSTYQPPSTRETHESMSMDDKQKKKKKKKQKKQNTLTDLSEINQTPIPGSAVLVEGEPLNKPNEGTLFFWLFSLSFAASIDFSVVLPTMFDYIKLFNGTIWFYGLCFGCYSICFFFSCLLLGYLADRRPFKELLLFCGLCLFGGNLLYCVDAAGSNPTAEQQHKALMYILASRCLCGIGSAIAGIGNAHIARMSSNVTRVSRLVNFRALELLGAVLAPAIGAAFTAINNTPASPLLITANNVSSFLVVLLVTLILLGFAIYLLIVTRAPRGSVLDKLARSIDEEQNHDALLDRRLATTAYFEHRFLSRDSLVLLLTYSIAVFALWSFEAAACPVLQSHNWSIRQNFLLFLWIGAFVLCSYLAFQFLSLYQYGSRLLLPSMLSMCVGAFTLSDIDNSGIIPAWQIMIASAFLGVGATLVALQLTALFARLMGARLEDLGVHMTWFWAAAGLARCLGPVWGAIAVELGGINLIAHTVAPLLLLGVLVAFCGLKDTADIQAEPVSNSETNITTGMLSMSSTKYSDYQV